VWAFAGLGVLPLTLAAQDLDRDAFAVHVLGEWTGTGVYDGNTLSLTRVWTLELGARFLRADMRVAMPDGASFGAVMYWKTADNGVYEVVWMDGTGRRQELHAVRDADTGLVWSNYLDQLAEDGPEWRRWEFLGTGPESYVERLFAQSPSGWALLTEFSFERRSSS